MGLLVSTVFMFGILGASSTQLLLHHTLSVCFKQSGLYNQHTLRGHFIRYTFLVLGRTKFGPIINSKRCWKHCLDILACQHETVNANLSAARSCREYPISTHFEY